MFPDARLYLTKNKQNEVVNENSKNLNQTKLIFQARVRKRALSGALSDVMSSDMFELLMKIGGK